MAHAPEIKTEAYELYLLGKSIGEIASELKRRHPGDGQQTPTAKTLENWAYSADADGKTWSERRYAAEADAMDSVTKDFVSAKSKLLAGTLRIQAKLQARAEDALESAGEPENIEQSIYALINVTKSVDKMLESRLADETRRHDAIDKLIEAVRRNVPDFDSLQPRIMADFQRLVNSL
jgi:hypothetical protein